VMQIHHSDDRRGEKMVALRDMAESAFPEHWALLPVPEWFSVAPGDWKFCRFRTKV
jgi:hypothetical protein